MLGEKFTLDIRPTFVDELDRTVAHIERKLRNPEAADRLIEDVYAAIDEMLDHPLVTAPVYREPDVAQPYYAIRVRNFTVYYIVREHVMEVRSSRTPPRATTVCSKSRGRSVRPASTRARMCRGCSGRRTSMDGRASRR